MHDQQDGFEHGPLRQLTRLLPLALLLLPTAASAAEKKLFVSSFERIRVEGPFDVTVVTGRAPAGTLSGDPRVFDAVEVRVDGRTLVVRAPLTETAASRPANVGPVAVRLATPTLSGVTVIGGGALAITGSPGGIRAPRLDLSVTGAGSIALTGADVEQTNVVVIGNGQVAVTGRAARARLLVNGAGKIRAEALDAGDLTVRVDGPGEVAARARFNASVINTGLGQISIAGTPKCLVKSAAGGPVTCGVPAR